MSARPWLVEPTGNPDLDGLLAAVRESTNRQEGVGPEQGLREHLLLRIGFAHGDQGDARARTMRQIAEDALPDMVGGAKARALMNDQIFLAMLDGRTTR